MVPSLASHPRWPLSICGIAVMTAASAAPLVKPPCLRFGFFSPQKLSPGVLQVHVHCSLPLSGLHSSSARCGWLVSPQELSARDSSALTVLRDPSFTSPSGISAFYSQTLWIHVVPIFSSLPPSSLQYLTKRSLSVPSSSQIQLLFSIYCLFLRFALLLLLPFAYKHLYFSCSLGHFPSNPYKRPRLDLFTSTAGESALHFPCARSEEPTPLRLAILQSVLLLVSAHSCLPTAEVYCLLRFSFICTVAFPLSLLPKALSCWLE